MSLTFTVGGRAMSAEQVKATAKKAAPRVASAALKRVTERDIAKQSDGFVVVGYSPAHWSQREHDHAIAKAHFGDGRGKNPGTLDEFMQVWLGKNKPRRVRSKPYKIASAAETCAELARKAGWQFVAVDEILKGQS